MSNTVPRPAVVRPPTPEPTATPDPDPGSIVSDDCLEQGERIGRFVVLLDQDGVLHAVAAGTVGIIREVDGGTLLALSGGKMLVVNQPMRTVLRWMK